jgi:hypothetical protein
VIAMRVLVAYENDKRIYRDAVTMGIQHARPHVEVTVVDLQTLEEGVARFAPHLVICSPSIQIDPVMSCRVAWVELSPHPERPSKICVEEQPRELLNPSFEELIAVVD